MADSCCESACGSETARADPRWRRVLWVALLKSLFMMGFSSWVLASAVLAFVNGTTPDPATLVLTGGIQVLRQAVTELNTISTAAMQS